MLTCTSDISADKSWPHQTFEERCSFSFEKRLLWRSVVLNTRPLDSIKAMLFTSRARAELNPFPPPEKATFRRSWGYRATGVEAHLIVPTAVPVERREGNLLPTLDYTFQRTEANFQFHSTVTRHYNKNVQEVMTTMLFALLKRRHRRHCRPRFTLPHTAGDGERPWRIW